MRDFFEWVFALRTPMWVSVVVMLLSIIAFVSWIVAAIAFESFATLAAPPIFAAWLVWGEYKRSKDDA